MASGSFILSQWYASEAAKRAFGRICHTVNEEGEAKADWPGVTLAAAIYGTRFRIRGKRRMRAIIFKDPEAKHPAERYRRSGSPDANRLAEQMEVLATEIRKLGRKLTRVLAAEHEGDLSSVTGRLEQVANIIERRFRELWRASDARGLTAPISPCGVSRLPMPLS